MERSPSVAGPGPEKARPQPIPATRGVRSLNRRGLPALRPLVAPGHAPTPATGPGDDALDLGHLLGTQRAVIETVGSLSRLAHPPHRAALLGQHPAQPAQQIARSPLSALRDDAARPPAGLGPGRLCRQLTLALRFQRELEVGAHAFRLGDVPDGKPGQAVEQRVERVHLPAGFSEPCSERLRRKVSALSD